MTRLLYLDCIAGVSGDMLLGALLDSGADIDRVRAGLRGLGVQGLEIELGRTERQGVSAARVTVRAPGERAHRTWSDVRAMVDHAGLPERARERAQAAFAALARAEGRVHRIPPEQVHFHEVGAVDALADVCGTMLALEDLGVQRVVCSPLPMARGFVDAAHGRLPLPAPATLELLRGAPLHGVEEGGELVTPTGATLVASLAEGYGPLPPMRLEAVGYGAGARELHERPNLLRAMLGEPLPADAAPLVSLIEANLDDLSPELVPDAAEEAYAAGAIDVWSTPAQMKKGRPGLVLSALARPAEERAVARALLRGTSTLGVRMSTLRRWELEREWQTVRVGAEAVRVKVGRLDGEVVNLAPEHDDCLRVARRSGRPVKAVWAEAFALAERGGEP